MNRYMPGNWAHDIIVGDDILIDVVNKNVNTRFKPIQLTVEWLEKLDFEKVEINFDNNNKGDIAYYRSNWLAKNTNVWIEFELKTYKFRYVASAICEEDEESNIHIRNFELKYVHQLQNLINIITEK